MSNSQFIVFLCLNVLNNNCIQGSINSKQIKTQNQKIRKNEVIGLLTINQKNKTLQINFSMIPDFDNLEVEIKYVGQAI